MREAAEAGDDVPVVMGPFHRIPVPDGFVERDRALLVAEILRVRERQVEEAAQGWVNLAVVALLDRPVGGHERRRIGRVDPPRAAEHVARELGLEPGTLLDLVVEGREVRLRPVEKTSRELLQEMIAEAKRLGLENEPESVDWGPDRGSEIIDDDDPK